MANKRLMSKEITRGRALGLGVLAAAVVAAIVLVATLTLWCDYNWRSPFARADAHSQSAQIPATPIGGSTGEGAVTGAETTTGYDFTIAVGPEAAQASVAVGLPEAQPAASNESAAPEAAPKTNTETPSDQSGLDWFSTNGWKFLGWLLLLLAAAGLFWKIFEYLNDSREDYYAEHDKLVNRGWIPQLVAAQTTVNVLVGDSSKTGSLADAQDHPADFNKLEVDLEGPDRVEIGDSALYQLKVPEGEKLPPNVRIDVDLQDKGNVGAVRIYQNSQTKDTFVVVGLRTGKVELRVSVKGELQEKGLVIEIMPKAEPSPSKSVPLMVFGTGSHTLIMGTLAVFVLLMLTLSGAIPGTVVAPLIGTLIGYLFGVNVSSGGGGETQPTPER